MPAAAFSLDGVEPLGSSETVASRGEKGRCLVSGDEEEVMEVSL